MMNIQRVVLGLMYTEGIGAILGKRLLDHFSEDVSRIWDCPRTELLEIPGIHNRHFDNLQKTDWENVDKELEIAEKTGSSLFCLPADSYPNILKNIYDPPILLYGRGKYLKQDQQAIAIVGTRKASYYGLQQAQQFAYELAKRGVTIVSGLAKGVDIAAHRGALEAGGRTIAVLGSGLERIYPAWHKKDAQQIMQQGIVFSEYPFYTEPLPMHFPRRNRIISGLSLGIIVIEARLKSGALITAHVGLEQGREIFALPGEIGNALSQGPHTLIQQGAKLVTNIDDILEEIQPLSSLVKKTSTETQTDNIEEEMTESEKKIWDVLSSVPKSLDFLSYHVDLSNSELHQVLFQMEIKGWISLIPGSGFLRNTFH